MIKFAPRLMVLLLCGTALAGCADSDISSLTGSKTEADHAKVQVAQTPTTDLDSGIRQAQLLRQAEHYDEAVHILSQLMLVASDDGRVVGEYGKTLVQMGRAQDAAEFLGRAIQLQPGDWTAYSALGVAYDQLGDQVSARMAYEHALAVRPNEPSILNNYALSRMLANDPAGAHQLIERARLAGGAIDPKIARNIELVNKLAVAPEEPKKVAAAAPVSAPVAAPSAPPVQPKPVVVSQPVTVASLDDVGAPRPLHPQTQGAPTTQAAGVVMQRVPVDPLAGPAKAGPAKNAPAKTAAAASSASKPVVVATADKPAASTRPVVTEAKSPLVVAAPAVAAKPAPVTAAATPATATQAPTNIVPPTAKTNSPGAPNVTLATIESPVAVLPVIIIAPEDKPVATAAKTNKPTATPAAKGQVKTADAQVKNGVPALRMAADRY